MKLQNDKKLLKHLHANSPIRDDQDGIRIMTAVDQYLEEHGFHIYPTKKEKGTVSFKQVYHHKDFVIQPDDMVRLVFGSHEKGTVVMFTATELRMMVEDNINRKISFGEEEKPSADGKEAMLADASERKKQHTTFGEYFGWSEKKLAAVEKSAIRELEIIANRNKPEYIPFQRCPVCEGSGKEKAAPFPYTDDIGKIALYFSMGNKGEKDCHCCLGSGCIPMKRETK